MNRLAQTHYTHYSRGLQQYILQPSFHHSGGYFLSLYPHQQTCPLSPLLLSVMLSNARKPFTRRVPSPSSPSFLDITPALQQYLSSPLSFTHDSPSILSKRTIHTSQHSLSSHHTYPQFSIEKCGRMCHSIISLPFALSPLQLYKSHNPHTLTPTRIRITNSAS